MNTQIQISRQGVALSLRPRLLPVAKKVFWWGVPEEWLEDQVRFVAQVMTYGDWDDVATTAHTLGLEAFDQVLDHPPAGVFDPKSWNFWHLYRKRAVPPLPQRIL